ncbi:MAG: nucleoside triphosphate pyrophosphohydrolase, partial [Verrucomicrobiota bacterium]
MALPIPDSSLPPIERLREIMHLLRSPGGCPWDAEQTHESLVPHLIEEAYEVAEAVKNGDDAALVDELGDLLLQPIFQAEVASSRGAFDFDDVANAIVEKLIRRHPHVFGDTVAEDSDSVLTQWEQIKAKEKGSAPSSDYYLKKANEGLPSLMSAQKIQRKVAKVGFDWDNLEDVIAKVEEELTEVKEAITEKDQEHIEEEIGDLLFSVVNLSRKIGADAELLLDQANRKFVERFQKMEAQLKTNNQSLGDVTLDQMDAAWELAKH